MRQNPVDFSEIAVEIPTFERVAAKDKAIQESLEIAQNPVEREAAWCHWDDLRRASAPGVNLSTYASIRTRKTMTAYDPIAALYKKTRTAGFPYRPHLETYTYFNMLGDLVEKSILDLGCGEGSYTREFKKKGAARVVGMDISEKLIELARLEEAREPLGIEYFVGNARELGQIGSFDLVTTSYMLAAAQTKEQLLQMCQSIFANLKPSGRFVSINDNLELPPEYYPICDKYGACSRSVAGPLQEGTPITLTFTTPGGDQKFTLYAYYLSKATYEWAFRAVGFKEVYWQNPVVSPEGVQEFGQEFWQDALKHPPIVGIECVK